jgi:NodT family efflux transporter outer membrane factor (OMF) lipoprotein
MTRPSANSRPSHADGLCRFAAALIATILTIQPVVTRAQWPPIDRSAGAIKNTDAAAIFDIPLVPGKDTSGSAGREIPPTEWQLPSDRLPGERSVDAPLTSMQTSIFDIKLNGPPATGASPDPVPDAISANLSNATGGLVADPNLIESVPPALGFGGSPHHRLANAGVESIAVGGNLVEAWQMFGDPALREMIQRAIDQNPNIREAEARIAQSRALFGKATADLFPQVSATGQYGYRRFSQNGNAFVQNATTAQGFDWYSTGFDTRWEVDLFGRLRSLRSASGFEAVASEQTYRDVMVSLVGDLMLAYVEYALAAERIRIARQNLQVQESILELTLERLRIGEDGELAVAQARTQVEITRTTIPAFQEQHSVALHRLLLLQGIGAQSFDVPAEWGQSMPQLPVGSPKEIDCEWLSQRPDIRASRLLVAAQLERLGASKAEYYPQVSLNGNISLETRDLDVWWDENSVAHSVGPVVSLNLLDFGRIRAAVMGERAKYEQAVARYEQSVQQAIEEVRNAMVGVDRQRARAAALETAAQSARSVVEMARVEYREGLTNFQSVLDAERQVLSIEDQRAVAYGTALIAYGRLFKALGGIWYVDANVAK